MGLRLVEAQTVSGSAVTTVTFSGLGGNADYRYRLLYRIFNPTASSSSVTLRPNGVATNQASALAAFDGATDSHASTSTLRVTTMSPAVNTSMGYAILHAATGLKRGLLSASCQQQGATADTFGRFDCGLWDESATEITSLDLVASFAASIGVGSTFYLYSEEIT